MTTLDKTALEAATAEWLNWTDRTAGEGLADHLARAITAYLDALSSIPEQGVGVTALEAVRRMIKPNAILRAAEIDLGFPRKAIFNALTYLARTGELARVGYGKYQAPPADGRPETTSEHIARDMRDGRFPERSEPLTALAPSQPAAVGEGENAFAGYEGVTAKELAETVARYGKALSQIDRSWAAAVSGASTDIPNITGWTGSLDNYGQIFAWVARAALRSTP